MDRHEELPTSVRLAMCLAERAERERDPPCCRASGLTPELSVHVRGSGSAAAGVLCMDADNDSCL